ncbi:hypothetical protein V8C44DRAFT_271802 [Trichoderma aethiopicum]
MRNELYESIQMLFQHLDGVPSRAIHDRVQREKGRQSEHPLKLLILRNGCSLLLHSDTLDIQPVIRQKVKRLFSHRFPRNIIHL